jgi:hypothetical protein
VKRKVLPHDVSPSIAFDSCIGWGCLMVMVVFNGDGNGQQQGVGKAVGATRGQRRCNNQIKAMAAVVVGGNSGRWCLTVVMDNGVQWW